MRENLRNGGREYQTHLKSWRRKRRMGWKEDQNNNNNNNNNKNPTTRRRKCHNHFLYFPRPMPATLISSPSVLSTFDIQPAFWKSSLSSHSPVPQSFTDLALRLQSSWLAWVLPSLAYKSRDFEVGWV